VTSSAAIGALIVSAITLGVAALFWRQRIDRELQRTQQLGRLAEDAGWSFTSDDVFDYAAMPFALFEWKPGGRAGNVMVGATGAGRPVCAFDYRIPAADGTPPTRFTCVITDLGGSWPRLVVQPRERGARWPSLDVALLDRLEPIDAHDGFRAWTDDLFFAQTFLDSPLGDWLGHHWPSAQFEISGALLLVWFPQRPPRKLHDALRASDALCSRIPGEVWAHYPADKPGGAV
jgi:hypothetical protein